MSETTQQPIENQEQKDNTFGRNLVQYDPKEPRYDVRNAKLFLAATADICYAAMQKAESQMEQMILSNAINKIVTAEAVVTASLLRNEETKLE